MVVQPMYECASINAEPGRCACNGLSPPRSSTMLAGTLSYLRLRTCTFLRVTVRRDPAVMSALFYIT